MLVSETFRSIELVSAKDSLGTPVEHRWSNFAVLFAGDTVDSWRVDSEHVGFSVPVLRTGDYSVRVVGNLYTSESMSARVLGLRHASVVDDCDNIFPRQIVPVSGEVALLFTWCNRSSDKSDADGTVMLRPGLMANGWQWLEGAYMEDAGEGYVRTSVAAAGQSYRPGYGVLEHPVFAPPDTAPQTWVWEFGRDPAPISTIDCYPPGGIDYASYVPAEVAPGVCVTMNRVGNIYRNGAELLYEFSKTPPHSYYSLRVGPRGTVAPVTSDSPIVPLFVKLSDSDSDWPVVISEGTEVYTIAEYRLVTGVAFSSGGDSMFVAADTGDRSDWRSPDVWVLDIRQTETGELLKREMLGFCVFDLRHATDRLWLLRCGRDDEHQTVEVRSTDLTVERGVEVPSGAIALSPHSDTRFEFLMPATDGRRAYLFDVWQWYVGLAIVDVF